MKNINQHLETGESKGAIAKDLKVLESTLKTILRMGTVPTSLIHFKATFSNVEEKDMAEYCKHVHTIFCRLTVTVLKELATECAECTGIDHRLKKKKIKKPLERTG
jgi:hypothetical protein